MDLQMMHFYFQMSYICLHRTCQIVVIDVIFQLLYINVHLYPNRDSIFDDMDIRLFTCQV